MQFPRSLATMAITGLLVAACGGAAPTQSPGGGDGTPTEAPGGGTPTEAPGGGNGNGGGEFGSVKFTVSGPFDKSDEYPFIPAASVFGNEQGTVLNFSDTEDATAIVSILIEPSGTVVVSFSGTDGQVPAATCTTTDLKVEARNASGKFDCTSTASMSGSGAVLGPGRITGEFSARA